MDNIEFQLYEKRIDSCWATVEKCAEGTWAKDYWQKTAMLLFTVIKGFLKIDQK